MLGFCQRHDVLGCIVQRIELRPSENSIGSSKGADQGNGVFSINVSSIGIAENTVPMIELTKGMWGRAVPDRQA
jgi:hypothetical protein